MRKIILIAVILLVVVFLAYRMLIPKAFVAAGKKGITADKLNVVRIGRATTASDDKGKPVTPAPGNTFIQIDCQVTVPFDQMDVYDFQLVKAKAAKPGTEENVGYKTKNNYFFGTPISKDGVELKEFDLKATDYFIRLIYQIPETETKGYLFYWGDYWGPLNLKK